MASIVLGVAASHTPQLSAGVDLWEHHGEVDRTRGALLGRDGHFHEWDELVSLADFDLETELNQDVYAEKYRRAQDALKELSDLLAQAQPDVVVVIGDDQWELFQKEGVPTFSLFTGETLFDQPPSPEVLSRMTAGRRAAQWAAHGNSRAFHKSEPELSCYLVEQVANAGFDVHRFEEQREDRTLGHAFTFPRYRLGLDAQVPIVPLFINTYYPPNVPTAQRCYELGQAVGAAIRDWDRDLRVAVVTSGGLSHFVINENLDRKVLRSLEEAAIGALAGTELTRDLMRSGNSEILNWVTAAGMLGNREFTVLDYLPAYRSIAGTGTGMAFGYWQ